MSAVGIPDLLLFVIGVGVTALVGAAVWSVGKMDTDLDRPGGLDEDMRD